MTDTEMLQKILRELTELRERLSRIETSVNALRKVTFGAT